MRRVVVLPCLLGFLCIVLICEALVLPSTKRCSTIRLHSTNNPDNDGVLPKSALPVVSTEEETKVIPQLRFRADKVTEAFSNLKAEDQYDAVLTGLCAKILDADKDDDEDDEENQEKDSGDEVGEEKEEVDVDSLLQDSIELLDEMNMKQLPASGRSLMALVDATVKTEDPATMSTVMSLALRNGAVDQYGGLQRTMSPLPQTPNTRVRCPDGKYKTRQKRLEDLPDVPSDERGNEVASALGVGAVAALCVLANLFGMEDVTPYSNVVLGAIIGFGVVDNFYDILRFASGLVNKQVDEKVENTFLEDKVNVKLPEKGSMPLTLGTGQATGTVLRGVTRLLSVDTERECQCEAAAFFAAYSLGLPCFAFRPNALEAALLAVKSLNQEKDTQLDSSEVSNRKYQHILDPLLTNVGIMKLLVWLMAPVAMESAKHPQLIASNPQESRGFLKRLEDRADVLDEGGADLWWKDDEKEREDLLKWAYTEADLLLRSNKEVVEALSERLASGAATIGDCVAVVESL